MIVQDSGAAAIQHVDDIAPSSELQVELSPTDLGIGAINTQEAPSSTAQIRR